MTIKEFYKNGYQLVERTPYVKTKEYTLDHNYQIIGEITDAFPQTNKSYFEIIDSTNNNQLPHKFSSLSDAIKFIQKTNNIFQ